MKRIITKEIFFRIFENPIYREKLDKIILNYFGLETNKKEEFDNIKKKDTTLEISLFLNTEILLKIIIKDTEHLLKKSKKFYLNISYLEVEKYQELLMPCYWEIYSKYALENPKNNNSFLMLASLFSCENIQEIKKVLNNIKEFSNTEKNDILKTIEKMK